jgi:hypothetical protein
VPRYFFHVHDGEDLLDREGLELPGSAEAREQAITTAGEMIRQSGVVLSDGSVWIMRVVDENGREVFTLRFSADDHTRREGRVDADRATAH